MSTQVTRVGCRRDARKALAKSLEFVNSGAYRAVYTDRSRKVAYKVDRDPVYGSANEDEVRSYVTLCQAYPEAAEIIAPTTAWRFTIPFGDAFATEQERDSFCNRRCERRTVSLPCGDWCDPDCVVPHSEDVWPREYVTHRHPAHVTFTVAAQPMYPEEGATARCSPDFDYGEYDRVREAFTKFDIGDFHDGNWCVDDTGRAWVTDFQFASEAF